MNGRLRFAVGDEEVSALWLRPEQATAALVLAHGAGVGMEHSFMAQTAVGLAERGVATLRFQFPYMESGRKRPDSPAKATATIRAAVAEARRLAPDLPLFAGGKSFGGRMTSTAEADAHLDGVGGIVFFGFPLHASGKPDDTRASHLFRVRLPMLFLQGTRDRLAEIETIRGVCKSLGRRARIAVFDGADHSFKVPKSGPVSNEGTMTALLDTVAGWMADQRAASVTG